MTMGAVGTGRRPGQGGAEGRGWAVDIASKSASDAPELRELGKVLNISEPQFLPSVRCNKTILRGSY